MVGHSALGEIVGADSLVAHTGAHLAAAHAGDLGLQLFLLDLVQLGGQHTHTFFPVLYLAALFLAGHHDARGLVDQPHCGAGLINMLTACAGCPIHLHLNVRRVNLHIHLVHFRQHRHGSGGGMDSAAGFCLRHTLYPVDAGLVLQPGIRPPSADNKIRFLDTAQLRVGVVHQFDAPALLSGVHGVHPVKAVGKQGAFLAAHTAADLHDDAFFVVGVFGQQQDLQFLEKFFTALLGILEGLLAQLPQLRVAHQLLGLLHFRKGSLVGPERLNDGLQVIFLPQRCRRLLGIVIKIRLLRTGADLLKTAFHRS